MDDFEYVKRFSNIHVSKICEKMKVDRANILTGKAKKENAKKVRAEIESEIAKLYIKKEDENNEVKEESTN